MPVNNLPLNMNESQGRRIAINVMTYFNFRFEIQFLNWIVEVGNTNLRNLIYPVGGRIPIAIGTTAVAITSTLNVAQL
jgi:hypothetical protein